MENQSYDHMLGWLGEPYSSLKGSEQNKENPNLEKSVQYTVSKGAPFRVDPDPPHDFPEA